VLGANQTLQLSDYQKALIGKHVSHVWRGYGSALFLEIGRLSARKRLDGSPGQPDGELTLGIEWSWRIEKARSILGGSWSSEAKWPGFFSRLVGAEVTDFQVFGRLPEAELRLSNGLRVLSFMTSEGQPQWSLVNRTGPITQLTVANGKLRSEQLAPNNSFKPNPLRGSA
jgi:hypothetical protein